MPETMEDRITLRLPPNAMERLRLVALLRDVTISELVRDQILREIEQAEEEWSPEGAE